MTNLTTWKLNWIDAIADASANAEQRLTPLAVLIAIKFATKYMQKTGTEWYMGADSLAEELGRDRRNIRDALAELKGASKNCDQPSVTKESPPNDLGLFSLRFIGVLAVDVAVGACRQFFEVPSKRRGG